jgi:WD40 repeat protein
MSSAYALLKDRETQSVTGNRFFSRITAPDAGLVGKLQRRKESLVGHDGCVNTISFAQEGTRLISGSDDLQITVWDWDAGASVWPPIDTSHFSRHEVSQCTAVSLVTACTMYRDR